MFHLHYFKPVGNWDGSWALKQCRCGEFKLVDLWGFAFEHTPEQKAKITEELKAAL